MTMRWQWNSETTIFVATSTMDPIKYEQLIKVDKTHDSSAAFSGSSSSKEDVAHLRADSFNKSREIVCRSVHVSLSVVDVSDVMIVALCTCF